MSAAHWELVGVAAMLVAFAAIRFIQRRGKFGEARFDSETGKLIDDE